MTTNQRVTITFWHGMTGQNKTVLNQLIRDFNHSQSRYKVVGSAQGTFTNLQQKIMTAAKSGNLPTMSQTTYTNVPNYVKGNLITPLNTYISQKDLKTINPVFLKSGQYHNKTYSLPFSKSVRIMYYNPKLLKKLHLQVPTTWNDIHRAGETAKKHGYTGIVFDQNYASELNDLIRQTGTPMISSHLKVTVDSRQALAATHVIWDMLQDKTATTAGEDGYGNVKFLAGKTLFYCGSSAAIGVMQASSPKNMIWRTTQLPSYQGKRATSLAGNDLVLFKSASSTQRKGAAAFMTYLLKNRQTIKWAEKTGYLPLTTAATHDRQYQHYLAQHPQFRAASKSLDNSFSDPAFLGYNQYLSALESTTDSLATTTITPEKAMSRLQQQAETIINQNQ
ncbi:ABC transporter substrate-binding protein [Lactiplantibacillus pentosus]|uniref:ABC transporter substrate-binding protein n=1 Tax=Lactiplantibacillus pentosus TaxID=1589 RepID=UPI001CDAE59C|nr:ABC transporter substrate-binding protein [Lactiplantibacillus pentosus]